MVRTEDPVVVYIINVFVFWIKALFGHGPFVGKGRNPAILKNLFGDPWRFIAGIPCDDPNHGITRGDALIKGIKSLAVVDIAGGNGDLQYKVVSFTDRMGAVGKALAMFSFLENATFRIGCRFRSFGGFGSLKGFLPCFSRS